VSVYFAPNDNWLAWLGKLEGYAIFAPASTRQSGGSWLERFDPAAGKLPDLDKPRAAQSPKGFFLPPIEAIARYGQDAQAPQVAAQQALVLGVRNCELRALAYFDKVMLAGCGEEPQYKARRQAATIASCDCVDCAATCHCTLVGGQPFVQAGSDVNLTALAGGVLVEPLSPRGEALLAGANFAPAADAQLQQRQQLRQQMLDRLAKQNKAYTYARAETQAVDMPEMADEGWQKFAADCVECGACTNVCPTCYCFYLFDHKLNPNTFERGRNWDSCLLATYHRMAGTPGMKMSPRPELRNRLANRILHKMVYSVQQYGMLGCVGCGRCCDACLGAIDIREVVEGLKK
jgi:ferredoxin